MKLLITLTIALIGITTQAKASDVYVKGYTTDNGTYVQPYHRSSPDSSTTNNYGSPGNSNPYKIGD